MQLKVMREEIKKGSNESRVPGTLTSAWKETLQAFRTPLEEQDSAAGFSSQSHPLAFLPKEFACLMDLLLTHPLFFLYLRFLICKIGDAVLEQR